MKDMPQRTKILMGLLALVLLVTVYMQFSGGGSEDYSPTPSSSAPPAASAGKTGASSGKTSGGSSPGASSDKSSQGLPADPTQSQRPSETAITPVGNFPGTEPPVITYNPYIAPPAPTG